MSSGERQARGFFQRMNDWLNKDSKQDLASAMSRYTNSRADYGNYDYYDETPVRRAGFGHHGGGDHYGAHSGYGYCEEDQVSIGLLVTALAGIALMWYTLYTKIQANGGRKKRDDSEANSWFPVDLGSVLVKGKLFLSYSHTI